MWGAKKTSVAAPITKIATVETFLIFGLIGVRLRIL